MLQERKKKSGARLHNSPAWLFPRNGLSFIQSKVSWSHVAQGLAAGCSARLLHGALWDRGRSCVPTAHAHQLLKENPEKEKRVQGRGNITREGLRMDRGYWGRWSRDKPPDAGVSRGSLDEGPGSVAVCDAVPPCLSRSAACYFTAGLSILSANHS